MLPPANTSVMANEDVVGEWRLVTPWWQSSWFQSVCPCVSDMNGSPGWNKNRLDSESCPCRPCPLSCTPPMFQQVALPGLPTGSQFEVGSGHHWQAGERERGAWRYSCPWLPLSGSPRISHVPLPSLSIQLQSLCFATQALPWP